MELILFQPEIPQNAGNIARTCALTHTKLTLVRPLGFSISSRHMKRAGLDYWDSVDLEVIEDLESHLKEPFYFFSSKATKLYSEVKYEKNTQLIFGSETKGLPASIHEKWKERFLTIPMRPFGRSLNLSNAAAIVLYEALRQNNFVFE